jgi:hypothetical protein
LDLKKNEVYLNKLIGDLKLEQDNRRNLKVSASFKNVQNYNELKT